MAYSFHGRLQAQTIQAFGLFVFWDLVLMTWDFTFIPITFGTQFKGWNVGYHQTITRIGCKPDSCR